MKKSNKLSAFIESAKKKHGEVYDYSKVAYAGATVKVEIVCPEHGSFWQTPATHRKSGCPACGKERMRVSKLKGFPEFVKKSREAYGDKYDYSKVRMTSFSDEVEIVCPEHGSFFVKAENHANKSGGCLECRSEALRESTVRRRLGKDAFELAAKVAHGDKYGYGKVVYYSNSTKVEIVCPEHGSFWQTPALHMKGHGCPACGRKRTTSSLQTVSKVFPERSSEAHSGAYDYSKSVYSGYHEKVEIVCPEHGSFWQTPNNHLGGAGCPTCNRPGSKLEDSIKKILDTNGIKYEQRKWMRTGGRKWEIGFFLPDSLIGIECHGNFWHSEKARGDAARNLHFDKFVMASREKISLLQFFEDEINDRTKVVESMILHRLGKKRKIHARKTEVHLLKKHDMDDRAVASVRQFMQENHIQGPCAFSAAVVLSHGDDVVACMLFNRVVSNRGVSAREDEVELVRLAFSDRVVGGASKMLAAFLRQHSKVRKVVSYSDNRFGEGNVYSVLGFEMERDVPPDYWYIRQRSNSERLHKTKMKKDNQKRLQDSGGKFIYDSEKTEVQNAHANGFFRLWNAGLKRWVLKV